MLCTYILKKCIYTHRHQKKGDDSPKKTGEEGKDRGEGEKALSFFYVIRCTLARERERLRGLASPPAGGELRAAVSTETASSLRLGPPCLRRSGLAERRPVRSGERERDCRDERDALRLFAFATSWKWKSLSEGRGGEGGIRS